MAAEDTPLSPRCQLDQNGCVNLQSIVEAFHEPIGEEQAWAVCYQTAKLLMVEWASDHGRCYCLTNPSQVLISKDGTVHPATARCQTLTGPTRPLAISEYKLVTSLGLILFHALDYGLSKDVERNLSQPLEVLIDRLTSADQQDGNSDDSSSGDEDGESQNGDEGIERDSGEDYTNEEDFNENNQNGLTLARVLEMCAAHLSCPGQADSHYRAVCRALVAEALELSTFLAKVAQGTKELRKNSAIVEQDSDTNLDSLKFQDWARLWVQVIEQLRQGVKLKKVDVDLNSHPIEYELTPFEMLLDDIRSRRYKLNKVMVNGDLPPRVKKDAHALILEFIRSRPPLVPVWKRKLPPAPPRQPSLYEKLMDSIRHRPTLRHIVNRSSSVETSRTKLQEDDDTPQPRRRLIKADLTLRLSTSFDDDDDDPPSASPTQPISLPIFTSGQQEQTTIPTPWRAVALDLATQSAICAPDRRHSITVCESATRRLNGEDDHDGPTENGMVTDRHLHFANGSTPNGTLHSRKLTPDSWHSSQWSQSLECLSLTLEEVVHIRSVLTKAELDSLPVEASLYDDVDKGKVCFTCRKVRFSLFGNWGVKCKLCERMVCDRCSTKMHIPTEHFATVPVYTLSPGPSPPADESSSQSFWKLPEVFRLGNGSAPSSPNLRVKQEEKRTDQAEDVQPIPPHSESINVTQMPLLGGKGTWPSAKKVLRSQTLHHRPSSPVEKIKGRRMTVCRDCKDMVRHSILAGRTNGGTKKSDWTTSRKLWANQRAATTCVPSGPSSTKVVSPGSSDAVSGVTPSSKSHHDLAAV